MSNQTSAVKAARREQRQALTDKRKSLRHAYICRQLVAPFDGTRLPQQDEFEWAMFRDVSTSGISFLAESRPGTKQLVVAVGPAPFSFLVVEVVRVSRRDGLEFPFHIGCRILCELDQ